ncbi:MAG TPA: hypothetical protein VN181_07000 [Thermoanaerobaculia bacterium]|nr:hypothetical protein [Thermoanaerobaculia bacterium]
MRRLLLLLALVALPLVAQETRPAAEVVPAAPTQPITPPELNRCCPTQVYDAKGKMVGDVITSDSTFTELVMRYYLKDGDTIPIRVSSEYMMSYQTSGGSTVLFLTADCLGNEAFVVLSRPQPMKRQSVILPVGSSGQYMATGAWLFVSEPLATRVVPAAAAVFKSQWGETGACVNYPPPGYVYMSAPFGGYWMKRVEDLYKRWQRPFWIK